MNSFWILLGYEYKKLLKRKTVWVMFGLLLSLSIAMPFLSLLGTSSNNQTFYTKLMQDKTESIDLAGKELNEEFISEFQNTEKRLPNNLYNLFTSIFGAVDITEITEEKLYSVRERLVIENWQDKKLSDSEIIHLKEKEKKLKTPFIYQYFNGYLTMAAMFYSIAIMQTLFIAVCIPAIFADEHNLKMDQLILSSSKGKKLLYKVKIFVGISFSLMITFFLIIGGMIPNFCIYGTEGITAQIQLFMPQSSALLSVGQLILILLMLCITKAVLQSVIAMTLSERFRSSLAALSILAGGMIFASFIEIPEQYRLLSQAWNNIPSNLVTVWGVLDNRLVTVFGHYFSQWQVVPYLYLLLASAAIFYCYKIYNKFQIQ